MILRFQQVKAPLSYEDKFLRKVVAKRLKCPPTLIKEVVVRRRSLDCRHHEIELEPSYVLTLDVELKFVWDPTKRKLPLNVEMIEKTTEVSLINVAENLPQPRPVVVGAGPAGLFAALFLAEAGANPLLIERGTASEERAPVVKEFWRKGTLNLNNNVLFGEGGAGLFSDGKLTARTKDRGRMNWVFQEMVEAGAEKSILIDAEPHIGTDELQKILPKIRQKIIRLGGEVRFNTCLNSLKITNGILQALVVDGEEIEVDRCILAVGHSARDVYEMLAEKEVALAAKPFAIGVRLELPQARVNEAMYGRFANDERLPPANFKLIAKETSRFRSVYSFCMCPGGEVIICASENGGFTTNGMSNAKRNSPFANAAFLVPVGLDDFASKNNQTPLSGMIYQRDLEKKIFAYTQKKYVAVGQMLMDFLEERPTTELPYERSCAQAIPGDLHDILPEFVCCSLTQALPELMKKLSPVQMEEVLLYGIETRSSSPVRILRDEETLNSVSTLGLYPCGEGAGYAGGITTSAIDGVKVAEAVLATYESK